MKRIPDTMLPAAITKADCSPQPFPLCFALMLYAGLRVGETVQLAWCDLVYNHQPLAALSLTPAMTKRHRARELPINRALSQAIATAWRWAHDRKSMAPAHYALATRKNGPPLSVRTIERRCAALLRDSHRFHVTPHMLRHTFADRLRKVTDLPTVQLALGHKNLSTTAVYTHANNQDLTDAVQRLDYAQHRLTPA
jgi:site-specific recombinase XerC